ncbi:MAG: ACT domain-containing protein [Rickettsiales bacterium]
MLTLRLMPWQLSVVKLSSGDDYDWAKSSDFYSFTQTLEETSLLCESHLVPEGYKQESGWKVLKIDAILDFDMVGIIAKISGVLAEANVSIFALSTYNTDYILIKQDQADRALASLREKDYKVIA